MLLAAGYFALVVVSGVQRSPLTTPLPAGANPPLWALHVATWLGVTHLGRRAMIVASLLVMSGLLAAFGLLLFEAWSGRVRLGPVLLAAVISLALATFSPILLSRDILSYVAYARLFTVHHSNPYVTTLASIPHDPFVAVTSRQWVHTRSLYGPAFTLITAASARLWPANPGAVIQSLKLLAGVNVGLATVFTALAARVVRPQRAALAAAMVGLNPVMVIHTVGGGHVDALIAALLAGALLIVSTGPMAGLSPLGARNRSTREDRALGRPPFVMPSSARVTTLLTLASLVRIVVVPALILWIWWGAWMTARGKHRRHAIALHLGVVAGLSVAAFGPFLAGRRTFTPIATLGGVEGWASASHLVARMAEAVFTSWSRPIAGTAAGHVVVAAFLLAFAALFVRLTPRPSTTGLYQPTSTTLVYAWGACLLLLALTIPYLLPWYAAWFLPFMGLIQDDTLMCVGVAASGLLALTLIPADPFRGLTTWGVMDAVHYVVAPLMLLLLIVAGVRVLRRSAARTVANDRAAKRSVSRSVRIGVYLFLALFVALGLFEVQAWPFPSWKLFSHLRSDQSLAFAAEAVDSGGGMHALSDRTVPAFRNFFFVADHFSELPVSQRLQTCRAWLSAVRDAVPGVVSLRVYQVEQVLVPRSLGRPERPPIRSLDFSCPISSGGRA